jgi:hypothetical protein
MRQIISGPVVLFACLYLVVPAQGEYIYQLTDPAGVQQSNFVIGSVGQTVDVNVWLKQSAPDSLLTDEGLFSAGVRLTYGSPGIAEVLSLYDITPNPAFDDPSALLRDVGSTYSTLDMAVLDPFSPIFPQSSTPDRIWLGTFKFTGLSAGTVDITAMDNPGVDNTLTGLGTVLDATPIANGQASINAVPEPSSLVLFTGLVLVAGPYILLRRRRQRAA